jgi:glyoxylase-like metal-dependent hydrolase (beta-lactamase superfamily II)
MADFSGGPVTGDGQFADRPLTTVVAEDLDSVRSFFGFADWPDQVVSFDLCGRVLDLTGIPGHHPSSLGLFDPWTGFLLTGDTVYPGRLYGFDMPAFVASMTGWSSSPRRDRSAMRWAATSRCPAGPAGTIHSARDTNPTSRHCR